MHDVMAHARKKAHAATFTLREPIGNYAAIRVEVRVIPDAPGSFVCVRRIER
jgi:hypothetical protein